MNLLGVIIITPNKEYDMVKLYRGVILRSLLQIVDNSEPREYNFKNRTVRVPLLRVLCAI